MKKFILIVLIFLICNCQPPNQVTFDYYNSNSELEKEFLINSAKKFNQLVGCEAIELNHINNNKMAKFEDGTREIQIIDRDVMNKITAKTNAAYGIDSTAALTFLADGDVAISRDIVTNRCFYEVEGQCVYTQGEILFFHEMGHTFGLLHDVNDSDIMNKIPKSAHTALDFIIFVERLHQKTNICKDIKHAE